jgi:hypothetical protein
VHLRTLRIAAHVELISLIAMLANLATGARLKAISSAPAHVRAGAERLKTLGRRGLHEVRPRRRSRQTPAFRDRVMG